MKVKSKDQKADEAIEAIGLILTTGEITAYIEGETRKTVLEAAVARMKDIEGPKDGETGAITKTAALKGGIEGTKSVITGEDIIAKLRKEGREI